MYLLFALVFVLFALAGSAYRSNIKLWNGGRCDSNGLPWDAIEYQDGNIYLFAGNVARKVNGVLVPGVIIRNAERV